MYIQTHTKVPFFYTFYISSLNSNISLDYSYTYNICNIFFFFLQFTNSLLNTYLFYAANLVFNKQNYYTTYLFDELCKLNNNFENTIFENFYLSKHGFKKKLRFQNFKFNSFSSKYFFFDKHIIHYLDLKIFIQRFSSIYMHNNMYASFFKSYLLLKSKNIHLLNLTTSKSLLSIKNVDSNFFFLKYMYFFFKYNKCRITYNVYFFIL